MNPFAIRFAALAALLFPACTAISHAAEPAVVHAVQTPAWIERSGTIVPIRPGAPLLAGDVIRTGPGGRVQVDLPEGSRVKLGEDVGFRASRIEESRDAQGGFFSGVFDVLKGAFRFTTGLAGAERRRAIDFNVGVVTAGIRGTDIWGKSMADGTDMLLLIEGKVEISMPDHAAMMLEQPAHGVMMMPDGSMQMMDAMPAEMLQQYARETEMNEQAAMMMETGEWQLIVMSLRERVNAERLQGQLIAAGYPAEIITANIDSGSWHRVALTHLASAKDARMQGESMLGMSGITDFWIARE